MLGGEGASAAQRRCGPPCSFAEAESKAMLGGAGPAAPQGVHHPTGRQVRERETVKPESQISHLSTSQAFHSLLRSRTAQSPSLLSHTLLSLSALNCRMGVPGLTGGASGLGSTAPGSWGPSRITSTERTRKAAGVLRVVVLQLCPGRTRWGRGVCSSASWV